MVFDKLVWTKDRVVIDDQVFRLEDCKDDNWELGDECFLLHKPRRMIEQYASLWKAARTSNRGKILELGMFGGGSLAFWFEHFHPEKLVGVDISPNSESKYFQRYVASGARAGRIKTYWQTDQADRKRLREIVAQECGGSLDLVIDDASHFFEQTRISFETLFPLVRPGGLYIIEDWSWSCWPNLPDPFLPVGTELPALIFQLVEATGSMNKFLVGQGSSQILRPLIANLSVHPDFVVLERGDADMTSWGEIKLENLITRSPQLARMLKYPRNHVAAATTTKPWWRFW